MVEEFVMTKARRWDNSEWPNWLNEAWQRDAGENALWCDPEKPNDQLYLGTDEGVYLVQWGDTLVLGIDGSINYEPVERRAERLEADNAAMKVFIRRFSRWVEDPQKPDLFFGRLNLLYLAAEKYDDERAAAETAGEGS